MRPRAAIPIGLLAGLMLGAGALAARQAPRTYPIGEAPADLRPAIQRGDMAIVSLQGAILAELSRELDRGGALAAMSFCHLDAAGLAMRLGRNDGIVAGRTSHRLRNPSNAPRPWAAPLVARHAGARAGDVDGYAVDLGDRVGVLRPIAHRRMCGTCHGPDDALNPAVRSDLATRYPADRATGFREGDLRGWFWVEVPKTR